MDALFAAVSEAILETAARRGLLPGILAVLHTWNQQLGDDIHCLVTAGGLGPHGFAHRRRYLVSLDVLQTLFKGKLLCKLQALLRRGRTSIAKDSGHQRLRDASRRTWNIDIRRPFGGPQQVVSYLARYVRKIAISDHRLVGYDGQTVCFRYRDRRDAGRVKTAKVNALSFSRSFLRHVLRALLPRLASCTLGHRDRRASARCPPAHAISPCEPAPPLPAPPGAPAPPPASFEQPN